MKEETVIGVLLWFLEGEEARTRTRASLISRKEGDGRVVLISYGFPIAELREGEVVMKYSEQADGVEAPHIYARRRHRKWLLIIAQEKGISIDYGNYLLKH